LATVWKVVLALTTGCLLVACGGEGEQDRAWARIHAQDDAILHDFRQVKRACYVASARNKAGFDNLVARCQQSEAQRNSDAERRRCRDRGSDLLAEWETISSVCNRALNDLERRMTRNERAPQREADRAQADVTARNAIRALNERQRASSEAMSNSGAIDCPSNPTGGTTLASCR
jgi:hypothetical protein